MAVTAGCSVQRLVLRASPAVVWHPQKALAALRVQQTVVWRPAKLPSCTRNGETRFDTYTIANA
jgi:hypothetical protein